MRIVYDCTLDRPACPILQAVLGGDQHITNDFPVESWLIEPTPDMKAYIISERQLGELVRRSSKRGLVEL